MAGRQHASCYCVRKGLIRKAHLAHNLKKWAAKHPNGAIAKGTPETLIMEVDDVYYIDEALADVYEVCPSLALPHVAVVICVHAGMAHSLALCLSQREDAEGFEAVYTWKGAAHNSPKIIPDNNWVFQAGLSIPSGGLDAPFVAHMTQSDLSRADADMCAHAARRCGTWKMGLPPGLPSPPSPTRPLASAYSTESQP